MAYARPYGQAQSASPWSAGVPPGLQQQPQPQGQQMFNQPMGAFDLSGAWQGQPQAGQWAPQPMQQMQPPVQFVPNPNAFMHQQQQQPPQQQQQQRYHNQQQQQRPMHQRSLSAPRTGVNGLNKRSNQNNSFGSSGGGGGGGGGGNGGSQWQQRQNNNNTNNSTNNNNVHQQRTARQQSRQKVQFSNNNSNNNSSNNNNNNANNRQQNQQRQQGQQQQQQQQQQAPKKGTVKVTKVVKKQALRVKQGDAKAKSADSSSAKDKTNDGVAAPTASTANAAAAVKGDEGQKSSSNRQASKPQSKTAERKQFKLQARKNAEAVKQKKLPVAKSSGESAKAAAADGPGSEMKVDEGAPIDQAQLKCVPAVFGFVCKCCDVFLRDRFARREHIDSDDHMQKFKTYEEEQQRLREESSKNVEEAANNLVAESSEAEKKSTQEEDQESSQVEEPKLSLDEEPKPEVSSNENVGEKATEDS